MIHYLAYKFVNWRTMSIRGVLLIEYDLIIVEYNDRCNNRKINDSLFGVHTSLNGVQYSLLGVPC